MWMPHTCKTSRERGQGNWIAFSPTFITIWIYTFYIYL